MCELGSTPPKTFCIGFEDQSFSEVGHARAVARHLGTDHHEEIVTPDAAADLPMLAAHFDEPFADASAIPTYYLSRMTRQSVTVALSGDGGDEIFGGYRTYTALRAMEWLDRVPGWLRAPLLAGTAIVPESTSYDSLGRRLRRLRDIAAAGSTAGRYSALNDQWPIGERSDLLRSRGATQAMDWVRSRFDLVGGADPVSAAMWVDSTLYLPGDILVKVDRMSMLNSLEVRCPFLDADLVEYMAGLPVQFKVSGMTTKPLLKRLMAPKLPPGIAGRAKHGFGVPVGSWLRTDLRDLFADALLAPDALSRAWVDPKVLQSRWEQHLAGSRDNTSELWSALVLELWLRGNNGP
jgi:asparagine synthase (glutamine-hydrolysing)